MSIFDDIGKAFEDLIDYMKDIVDTVFVTIVNVTQQVKQVIEDTFRKIEEVANTVADAIKDVGITLSQGFIDGATTAINFLEKNAKEVLDVLIILPGSVETGKAPNPEHKLAISKAIASVIAKIALEGQEYDVFGVLAAACNDKDRKPEALKLGANIAAERVGNDIYNIPRVAAAIVKKEALKEYISWLIYKAATEKPQLMENGKSVQVVAGLVITAITTLLTEGKIADGAPAWPDTKDLTPDAQDTNAPTVWTEGSRISVGDAIYLILDGQVRHIPDPETYKELFDTWEGIIKSEEGLQIIGKPLTSGAYLAKSDEKVYLVVDGVKRWVASPHVFKKYRFNEKAIKILPAAKLNAIPTGDGIYQFMKREGSMLIMNGGAIHIILDGTAHHITNPDTYNRLFKNWNGIQEVNGNSIKIGAPISDDAQLVKATEKVYFINNGQKRWVMSPIAFNNFNFNWNKIQTVPTAKLDMIPEGQSIF